MTADAVEQVRRFDSSLGVERVLHNPPLAVPRVVRRTAKVDAPRHFHRGSEWVGEL